MVAPTSLTRSVSLPVSASVQCRRPARYDGRYGPRTDEFSHTKYRYSLWVSARKSALQIHLCKFVGQCLENMPIVHDWVAVQRSRSCTAEQENASRNAAHAGGVANKVVRNLAMTKDRPQLSCELIQAEAAQCCNSRSCHMEHGRCVLASI